MRDSVEGSFFVFKWHVFIIVHKIVLCLCLQGNQGLFSWYLSLLLSLIFVWRVLYFVNSVAWNGTQIKGFSQAALFYLFILFFFPLKCKGAKEISARKMWPFRCFLFSVWAVKVNFCNLHAHFHPALLGQSVPFKLSQLFLIYNITERKWIDLGRWETGIIWCLQYDP